MIWLDNLLIRLGLKIARYRAQRPFLRDTRRPDQVQRELLQRILLRNQETKFGQAHGFREIHSPEDYAAKVPISDYEDLRPFIDRQESEGSPELLMEKPQRYAQTSGSTGTPKLIAVSDETFERHRLNQRIFSCCHAAAVPGLFDGKIVGFVSPAIEGHLPGGTPYGSMSGMIYRSMPRVLRQKYLLPPEIFDLADYELKYLLIAIFAASDRSVTYAAAANPSTFLKLAQIIRREADTIIECVESGKLPERVLKESSGRRICRSFRGSKTRAEELRKLFADDREVTCAALWPELKAVSCWREGSCRVLVPELERLLPEGLPVLEMGYLASEFRGSLPVSSLDHLEVPTFHENYFEFIERSDWEAGITRSLTLAEIEPGDDYYIVITTQDGLYRYFMNDLVTVDGHFEKTPTIRFLEKGAGVTSITGEKLYESQLSTAIEKLARKHEGFPDFFVLVADAKRQRYIFYVEIQEDMPDRLAEDLDEALARLNIEYEAKRASGRLGPIELRPLQPGAGEAYKTHLIASGQREAQFKFLRLQSAEKLAYDFDQHLISTPDP